LGILTRYACIEECYFLLSVEKNNSLNGRKGKLLCTL
jgi:hypothetical protein